MRVVNERYETITEFDLSAGRLVPSIAVKEDAVPIDNMKKYAWADEDWEEVQMFIPSLIKTPAEKIAELKVRLRESDYHILKIVEGAATLTECADIIKQRALWRKEINELERGSNDN